MPHLLHRTSGDISKMDTINENEKGHKSVAHVDENVVQIDHVTLNKPTNSRYQCRWVFDFTDVTRKQLEIMAARKLVIDYRVPFKTVSEQAIEGLQNQTFMVHEILLETPQRLSPVQKAKKAITGLTKTEVKELLAGM